jgi:hypothetical protein
MEVELYCWRSMHDSSVLSCVSQPAFCAEEGGLSGVPPWINADLVRATIDAWHPHLPVGLNVSQATEILTTVGRLFDILES